MEDTLEPPLPPATKEQLLAKASEDIAKGESQLEEHDLDAVARSFAVSKRDIDIDLSHKNISDLPVELIDIIKDEVSRLALHRNNLTGLSGLSPRIHECTKLKYLALRHNDIREFPRAILGIASLEVLDLKCNRLESLPEDLDSLQNLRAFAIARNRVTKLPVCIARMNTLTMVSAWKNPIVFPPVEQWTLGRDEDEQRPSRTTDEDTARSKEETTKLKAFLVVFLKREKTKQENGDLEQGSGNLETTPRPSRRKVSGRPPIKPSVSGFEYVPTSIPASPMLPKLPTGGKLYSRPGNPTISAVAARPGVAPLINNNERNRSNSESVMSTSVKEKRMGYITTRKEKLQEKFLDVSKGNRLSHNRGLSHGSALQQGSSAAMTDSSSPTSPADGDHSRIGFVHRLSSLPEGKRKSRVSDPSLEFAKGLLYALSQTAGPIDTLLKGLKENGTGSEASNNANLKRQCWHTMQTVKQLEEQIDSLARSAEDTEEEEDSYMSLLANCDYCIQTFAHLTTTLRDNVRDLVIHGNPQHIRSLMLALFGGLMELKNACKKFPDVRFRPIAAQPYEELPVQGLHASPESDRPATSLRHRDATSPMMKEHPASPRPQYQHASDQTSLSTLSRSTSNASFSMSNTITTESSSMYGPSSRSNGPSLRRTDDMNEERLFVHIWHKLDQASGLALQALPACREFILDSAKSYTPADKAHDIELKSKYEAANFRCKLCMEAAGELKSRLQTVATKQQDARNELEFWQVCTAFTRAYIVFAAQIKQMADMGINCEELRVDLKPLQRMVKAISVEISASPWSPLAVPPGQAPNLPPPQTQFRGANRHIHNKLSHQFRQQYQHLSQPSLTLQTRSTVLPPNSLDPASAVSTISGNGLSSGLTTPLPATPMSAALGPAALATIPAVSELPAVLSAGYFPTGQAGAGVDQRSTSQRR